MGMQSDFNSYVNTYLSAKAKGVINYHSGNIPTYSANRTHYQNIDKYNAATVAAGNMTASGARAAITNTARVIGDIRYINAGRYSGADGKHSSTIDVANGYASLTSGYRLDLETLITTTLNEANITANKTISKSDVTTSLNKFYNGWINIVSKQTALNFKICHSSWSSCHSSGRSRR